MKVTFERSDRKYIYIGLFVLVFLAVSGFQYFSNKGLKNDIKDRDKINLKLEETNESLKDASLIIELELEAMQVRADSFQASERVYKNRYYATDKKLRQILSTYASSSDDDKWDAFTNSLHE